MMYTSVLYTMIVNKCLKRGMGTTMEMFVNNNNNKKLAEKPGVAREKKKIGKKKFEFFLALNPPPPRPPMSVHKIFSPIGLAVWPAIGNIYIYECLVLLYRRLVSQTT